jgi:hypothetical protein
MKKCALLILFSYLLCFNLTAQEWLWGMTYPSSFNTVQSLEMETDLEGNVYMIGVFDDSIQFELGNIIYGHEFSDDAYLVKYNAVGIFQWAKVFSSSGYENQGDLAIDPTNNDVVIAGYVGGITQFDSITYDPGIENRRGYIAKFDQDGNIKWVTSIDDLVQYEPLTAVTVDRVGNIYVAGGDDDLADSDNAYYAKLDSDGNKIWFKEIQGNDNAKIYIKNIEVNQAGEIYLQPMLKNGFMTIDSVDLSYDLTWWASQLFIIKTDNDGNMIWNQTVEDGQITTLISMDIDQDGNCYVAGGYFNSAMTINGVVMEMAFSGNTKGFLAKCDNNGNWQWAKNTNNIVGRPYEILTDCNHNVFLGGHSSSSSNDNNIWIEKYDTAGNFLWAKEEDGDDHSVYDFGFDGYGNLFFAGETRVKNVFSNTLLPYDQPFIAKLALDDESAFPSAIPQLSSPIVVCPDEQVPVISIGGENLNWYADTTLSNLVYQGDNYQPTVSINTNYYITQNITGCTSEPSELSIIFPFINEEIEQQGNFLIAPDAEFYQWYFVGQPIIDAITQELEITETGFYSVIAEFGDCTEEFIATAIFTNLEEIEERLFLHVFPNPASTEIHFEWKYNLGENVSLLIKNSLGETINRVRIKDSKTALSLGIESLTAGIYFCFLENEKGIRSPVQKIIIQ